MLELTQKYFTKAPIQQAQLIITAEINEEPVHKAKESWNEKKARKAPFRCKLAI